jgi:ubiquinone/menaquinone biosynthesis C-methylase UbiE/acyl carrier protein
MIEHKSVTNLASAHIEMILSVTHKKMSHYLCYSNYVFDAHVWELFPCILNGQVAHIVSNELRHDLKLLNNYIKDNAVNIATIPPIMLSNTELLDVDILIVAGDKTPKEILDIYHSRNTIVINAYGPTETTVCSTFNHYSNNGPNNIGRPISNTKCYVLNSQLRPIPIGAIGELYISGINLAKGYLNKPDLSTERFLDNPYRTFREKQHHQYQKLYKTGDLVRWLPDGALEYLSRNDFQVKIRGHRVELNEIENVLSAHEKIQQVVVITKKRANKTDENDSGQYLAAYYTQKRKNENACTYVNQWKEIYESHYSNLDINNYRYNFDSWMSSYTGKAMLKEDMREWLDSTLENIKRLNPNVILEIGSGSGLILFNMIDDCNHYYATDISENVANYTRKIITKFGYTDKVSVFSGESNELPFHQIRNHYDTAVLNSVIQYFPNLDYLETVINKIIKNIHKNGKIFIGDVRDLRLLKCFHCSLLRFKNQNVTIKEIEYFSAKDKELLISPEYFMQLKAKNNLISHVEIIPKMGLANTEMNNYRYDVILHICGADNNRVDLNDADFTKVIDFEFCLGSLLKKDLSCIKYPNKKIISDYLRYKNIIGENVDSEITEKLELVELKEILKQLHLKNYNAKFYININDPLYLNIIIYDNNIHKDKIFNIKYQPNPPLLKQELANNPSLTAGNQSALSKNDLNAFLKEKLPSYMIPDHYIAIDKIPITSSGKLDKSALPDFDFIASDSYKAPSNPEEITMVKVWASVLELPEEVVGVEDNFFRLGGHSILALRLASLVGSELGKAISVSSIFEFSTIRKLINHLNHNDKPSLSEKWVF